jgi:hypothetical protein
MAGHCCRQEGFVITLYLVATGVVLALVALKLTKVAVIFALAAVIFFIVARTGLFKRK